MKRTTERLRSSLQLLLRIPVRSPREPDFSLLGLHLPLTGIIAGLITSGVALGTAALVKDRLVAALVAVGVQYLVANLFHLDGLVDCADAFLGPGDHERTTRILKDSRIGVFGLFAGVLVLLLKVALIRALVDYHEASEGIVAAVPIVIAGLIPAAVAGRGAAAVLGATLPPANPQGLGALVGRFRTGQVVLGLLLSTGIALALAIAGHAARAGMAGTVGIAGALCSPVFCLAFSALAGLGLGLMFAWLAVFLPFRRRLGGFTGDGFGMAIELGEVLSMTVTLISVSVLAYR